MNKEIEKWEGVYLGMWVDSLIKIHPNTEWMRKPTVLRDVRSKDPEKPDLIVTYHYKKADIVLERATIEDPNFGEITVYAVQKIILKGTTDGHNEKHRRHENSGRGREGRRKSRKARPTR